MAKHVLKFYPVANGDTTLIKLSDFTTILIDCRIRDCEEDTNGNTVYDIKDDLLKEVRKKNSNSYIDLFVLTHPDEDHCLGFAKNFYTGDPSNYSKSNRENNEIVVNELWATSMLFNGCSNDDARELKKEAERRRKLWESNDPKRTDDGNRLRMIGYDGDERFESVPNSVPGETIELVDINGSNTNNFEIFIHGPFKKSLVQANAENDKNSSSIILQARFKGKSSDDWTAYFLSGGDADHYRWKEVLEKSEAKGNDDKLLWDIFQTPHHCSWTYFNDVPYDENKSPQETSLKVLNYGRKDAYIIASSRKIESGEPNPPHQAAKDQYVKKVKSGHFINTNTNISEKKPQPIIFEVDSEGLKRTDNGGKVAAAKVIAKSSVVTGHWAE